MSMTLYITSTLWLDVQPPAQFGFINKNMSQNYCLYVKLQNKTSSPLVSFIFNDVKQIQNYANAKKYASHVRVDPRRSFIVVLINL